MTATAALTRPIATRRPAISLPDPSEVFEAVSLLMDAGDIDRETAAAAVLGRAGFASWSALADAHAARIAVELDRLPAAHDATGARMIAGTRRFLTGPHWSRCVSYGWTVCDVFGVSEWSPGDRRDILGLVPVVAFAPRRGRRLEVIHETGATFHDPDGTEARFTRPSLDAASVADAVPWWRCDALMSSEAA